MGKLVSMTGTEDGKRLNYFPYVKIKKKWWVRSIIGTAAMVFTPNRIYVESEELKAIFEAIQIDIRNHSLEFYPPGSVHLTPSVMRNKVYHYLHEYYHIIQIHTTPWYKNWGNFIRDMFRDHDARKLEIEADEFGQEWKAYSPKEINQVLNTYFR